MAAVLTLTGVSVPEVGQTIRLDYDYGKLVSRVSDKLFLAWGDDGQWNVFATFDAAVSWFIQAEVVGDDMVASAADDCRRNCLNLSPELHRYLEGLTGIGNP